LTLTGLSSLDYKQNEGLLQFHIDVDLLSYQQKDQVTYKAYAEVWGTGQSGIDYTPIAWIQSIVNVEYTPDERSVVNLQLNEDWVHKATATAPFQLRSVWIEEVNSNVPLSSRERIYVDNHGAKHFKLKKHRANVPITEEMRSGPRPRALQNTTNVGGKLLLVHGYCASVNEFPPQQFSEAVQFLDKKAARSNDQFGLILRDFGGQFGSFGVVGHSQAGTAAIHLLSYYWSGLESAQGSRRIQSLGTPYFGSGLAGTLSGIGKWFGLGCGVVSDLTYDGASRWEAALPLNRRSELFYFRSIYSKKTGYCQWGANMVLYTPNDATTEIKKSDLSGANNMGVKESWCHTSGMKEPAQCSDAQRNADMNANAAR